MTGNILGIPFVFILMVAAEFDDDAGNLVELYDKLFESTFERKGKAKFLYFLSNGTISILTDVLIDENTSFVGTEVTGLQTNVDFSIAKGMENFEEMVYKGIISKRNPEC